MPANKANNVINPPNLITSARFVLSLIIFAILPMGEYFISLILFAIAAGTDWVDGYLARKMNVVTSFGKIADPIADKALTGVALVGLSILDDLAWWITVLILALELLVTVVRFAVISDGVIPASRGGKLKTVTQMIAIFLYLLPLTGFLVTVRTIVMGVALLLTVATGIDYCFRAIAVRRAAELRREAFDEPQSKD